MIYQDASTRHIILTLLKTKYTMSVHDIAKQLGITEMAVRRHLNTLEKDGMVETTIVRQAMGRPANMYSLSAKADDWFPKNYHQLVLDLLGELELDKGQEQIGKLFELRKEKLFQKYAPLMEGKSLPERVALLSEIQNENGYMVQWHSAEDSYSIQEFNCPITQVANEYQHACSCELKLFESLLETKVEQTECLAKGGYKCEYKIHSVSEA
ncbi:MAG: transcriptional regulator [Paenibacillus sp. RIFOXYA1_FULL_44_5]|nr:MAG: transcriptional regulator [Paenibacillus sp. RIFOXYA1_FULL_44_5]